jgi:hypothetical protein
MQAYIAYILLKCWLGGGGVASRWVFSKGRRIFLRSGTLSSMDIEKKKELWDRLDNEPERAYRAFEFYRNLPSGERTLIEAYRQHVGNRDAAKPSDTWSRWSSEFAWSLRMAQCCPRFNGSHFDGYLSQCRPRNHWAFW